MNGTWMGGLRESKDETRIFVVKVASRCNLACSYCYMYQHADQSWRTQPKFMSREVVARLGMRLDEYGRTVGGGRLIIVVHGGEPLLYRDLDLFFRELRRLVTSCDVMFTIQTNGTLINVETLKVLEKHDVRIGISVDGTPQTHNRARITHGGEGTYDRTVHGLLLARTQVPHLMQSVLQVIDTTARPDEVLDLLESYEVPYADFLFPDLNHDTLSSAGIREGEIGQWLTQAFNNWVMRRHPVQIRTFITIIRLLMGERYGTDQLGGFALGALMIETDGSYQVYDALKTTFDTAGHTGMGLDDSPIASVDSIPLVRAFRDKASAASSECLRCRLFPVCGGGSPLHRYGAERGFNQPSVYCEDLTLLIGHIRHYLLALRPDLDLVA